MSAPGKTGWNWRRNAWEGIWKYGPKWMRYLSVASPWISLALAVSMFAIVSGRYASSQGVVFDLPEGSVVEGSPASMLAIMLPVQRDADGGEETILFFDDARYLPSDPSSLDTFREALSARAERDKRGTLLLMADRRVAGGEIMRIMELARESGVKHVMIAEKRP